MALMAKQDRNDNPDARKTPPASTRAKPTKVDKAAAPAPVPASAPASADPREAYLGRLRTWRIRKDFDYSMSFLKPQFKREVEKPYKQLAALTEIWTRLVPASLLARTRLDGLSRGVLKVVVDSSGAHFELDRLLRGGLERQLIVQHKGQAIRKVQLRVGPLEEATQSRQPPESSDSPESRDDR